MAGPPAARPDAEPATGLPVRGWLLDRLGWLWPALLTLALGCYQLGRPELWRDELATWALSARSLPELLATIHRTDAPQAAYSVLMHFWMAAFGDSVVALRMPSLLAMMAAAVAVTFAGRRLAGPRAGLAAGLAFALIPSVSRFAQEARFYALATLLAAVATLALLRAIEAPGWRRWTGYGLCVALTGYADLLALTMLAGHAAAVTLAWRRQGWQRPGRLLAGFAAAMTAGAGCTLPLCALALGERAQIAWVPRPTLTSDLQFMPSLFYSAGAAAAMAVLSFLAWLVNREAAACATALSVLPVAAVWLASQGSVSYFYPRYLMFTVPTWAVLAGAAAAAAGPQLMAAALAALALLTMNDQLAIRLPLAHEWAHYPAGTDGTVPSYASAAGVVAQGLRAGDGIVYPYGRYRKWMTDFGVEYYLSRRLPPGAALPRQFFVARSGTRRDRYYPALCRHPAACAGPGPRVWVIEVGYRASSYACFSRAERAFLRQHYQVRHVTYPTGMTVALLTRQQA
jgi:mannosyltransferase